MFLRLSHTFFSAYPQSVEKGGGYLVPGRAREALLLLLLQAVVWLAVTASSPSWDFHSGYIGTDAPLQAR